jgi:tetratricopeptide (TPR) repeat protein
MIRVPNALRNFVAATRRPLTRWIPGGGRRWWIAAAVVAAIGAAVPLARALWQRQMIVDRLQRTTDECRRADENLLLAMATVGDRIDALGLETPSLEQMQLQFYKAIYDQNPVEPAERFAIAVARKRAGLLRLKLHETDESRLCFSLAIRILEVLAATEHDSGQIRLYKRTLAETRSDYAAYQESIGDPAAAQTEYAAALTILSKLIAEWPDATIDLIDDQAHIWHDRGAMAARLRHYSEAEADFNRAIAVWTNRCYAQSGWKEWLGSPACELAANWLPLSQMRRDAKQSSAAMSAINQVMGVYAQCAGYASDSHYREGHADALETLAGIYSDDQQIAPSVDAYRKALAEYESLASEHPEVSAYRRKHSQIESRLGSLAKVAPNRK